MTIQIIIVVISTMIVLIAEYIFTRQRLLYDESINIIDILMGIFYLIPEISSIMAILFLFFLFSYFDINLNKNQKITQIIFKLPKKSEICEGQVSLSEDKQGYISLKE